jgi:hypothetical protein
MAEKRVLPEDMVLTKEDKEKTKEALKKVSSQDFLDKYFPKKESTTSKAKGGSVCGRPTGKGFGKARKR